MTTLAELKTQAAALMADPSLKTFNTADLGYFINAGIAQVSRVAPQKFIEDVDLIEGTTSYPLRASNGNLVANPSFENGDETMFDGAYNTVAPGDSELTGGWEPSASMRTLWTRSSNAKQGLYVGGIHLPAATSTKYLYQNIPVNPGTTYYVSGWHWKGVAGGEGNVVSFLTLDDSLVTVTTDAVRHDTTAGTPQPFSGSIIVPDDGTVAYIQVRIIAYSAGAYASEQKYYFENINVTEDATAGVAANAVSSIEVVRVEVWSTDYDPARKVALIPRGRGDSESGFEYWGGDLSIPYRWLAGLDTSTNYLKVYGYAPYDKLTTATQITDLSFELEQAVMEYVRVAALERLSFERDLFTQWQTRSGNTDISPAALMSALAHARDQWRRTRRDILVLREGH